jgi:hypothetical protein
LQLRDLSLRNPALLGQLLETVREKQAFVQANLAVYVRAKQIALGSLGIVLVSQTIARRFSRHGPVSHRLVPFNLKIVQANQTPVLKCSQSDLANPRLDRYSLRTGLLSPRFALSSRDLPSRRCAQLSLRCGRKSHGLNSRNRDRCRNLNPVHSR